MVHVLLTNDDGPLSDEFSPYIKSFVDAIARYTDWDLTVVVPHTQRSWIGKAHFAGQTLSTTYIYPTNEGNDFKGPFPTSQKDLLQEGFKEWKLVDGTPASCADIGINHLNDGKPVDLVISGPNFGRNTSAVYITSSGTVGAAMEAANLGKRSVGISFGFETRKTDQDIVDEASRIGTHLIKHLVDNWSNEVDLYTINIPLFKDLKLNETRIHYAPVLANKWRTLFAKVDNSSGDDAEEDIVDLSSIHNQIQFRWKPDFHAVHQSVLESKARGEHNDGVVLGNNEISVTPLKALFKGVEQIKGEIKLDIQELSEELPKLSLLTTSTDHEIYLSIDSNSYIYPALVKSITSHLPSIKIFNSIPDSFTDKKIFQFGDYEESNFDEVHTNKNYKINSYIYRKALIRKHYLSHTIYSYVAKNQNSILKRAFPDTFNLEVDYAEFLDDSLDESYDLRLELEKLEKYWILKPGMSDKGQGIRVFKSIDQLQSIFDSFDEDDTDDEYEEEQEEKSTNNIITSQLRYFVVQEYMTNPLILENYGGKKFHIRTYVLSDGSISVSVFKRMLTLFSASKYEAPDDEEGDISMAGHLTNTCLQEEEEILMKGSVVEFSELVGLSDEDKERIFVDICEIVGEVFKAGLNIDKMNFQPLSNAFEIYGFDFLVDEDRNVKILEINAFPDFKQTGDDLKDLIFDLFGSVVQESIVPFFDKAFKPIHNGLLVNVLNKNTDNW